MRAVLLGPILHSKLEARAVLDALHLTPADMRVGVDGGTDFYMKLGLKPHIAVGDWDSLENPDALKKIAHLTLPRAKDQSDLFYAARAALNLGAVEIICAGVTGGRADQQMGVIYDLADIAAGKAGKIKSVSAYSTHFHGAGGMRCHFLSEKIKSWSGHLKIGQTVSLFSVGGITRGVTLKGFKYPLKNATLDCSSRGLSNRAVRADVDVRLRSGKLVVMIPE